MSDDFALGASNAVTVLKKDALCSPDCGVGDEPWTGGFVRANECRGSCMNLAADDEAGGNHSRLITELDQMAARGVNHLRLMASSEGAPTTQPFRMYPALQEAPGQYNEAIFVGLDRCLDEMQKRGMRATMTLNNQWQWSGGFSQYVSWANNNELIEYPSSWNLSKAPQRSTPGTGWGNWTEEGDYLFTTYPDFISNGNRIYTDSKADELYRNHINTVINRCNTVNGRVYKDDATVMTWEVANEPQPENANQYLGPYGLQYPPNPDDPLLPWIDRTSEYIKSLAPNQLCTVGLEAKQGEWYFKAVHNFSNVDYTTSHCWVQNWGVYDMLNSSAANLEVAKSFAREFIANTSQWSVDLGKPILLEEFGMARDNWKNVDREYLYLSDTSYDNKDDYFTTVIAAVIDDFKADGPYFGTAPWAYGGLFRPETEQQNEYGMLWAGDPPHEAPGWYDLYDTDATLDIIQNQQRDVSEFLAANSGS
ncbi:MAG: hypothetical protein Q9162_001979 [Coniocarpon cinnabarinum]